MWNKVVAALRKLLGLEKDIERIMKPFMKVARELETFAAKQAETSAAEKARAESLYKSADARTAASERATKLAGNVGGLL